MLAALMPACQPANPNHLPVDHIVVLMQENRSADTYLGPLHERGQPGYESEPTTGNPDPTNPGGPPIVPSHNTTYCQVIDRNGPLNSWNASHSEWDNGAMDGFTSTNADAAHGDPTGNRAMGFYDQEDLPFYYGLHSTFATNDRYFSSVLTQTWPNRLYLYAGTSFGHIANDLGIVGSTQRSIFELLDQGFVSWRVYGSQHPLTYPSLFFKYVQDRAAAHVFPISQYYADAAAGTLPSVAFVDPVVADTGRTSNDEHPPWDVQVGQQFVAGVVNALMASPNWGSSAMFFTYDEGGGYYDHVAPPDAPAPDGIAPMLQPGDAPGGFDRYGFRVPAVVVSPYAKPRYVSHVVDDHTSILRFIEYRFGLPSLTNRDAKADPMLDLFDFTMPAFAAPPTLPVATVDPGQLDLCPS
jgi:phospholipase C